jgi:uncharacterized protein (TIGR02646 family)
MIHADLDELDIPDELREALDEATDVLLSIEDLEERDTFIDKNQKLWQEIKPYLTAPTGQSDSDPKCWYCESKGPGFHFHVDHFRPKKRLKNRNEPEEIGYWWLAFDLLNFRLSCQSCNTAGGKGRQFPLAEGCRRAKGPEDCLQNEMILLLDPAKSGDRLLLAFSEDGRVYPRHRDRGSFTTKACTSIDVYDLNHVQKMEARKQKWLECKELARRAERALELAAAATSLEARQSTEERFEETCRDIEAKVVSSESFSAMARYCFRGTGHDWLLELIP